MAVALVVCVVGSAVDGRAEEPTPTLTKEQRLEIQVLMQTIEIAQLKAQAAQRDFDAAKDALVKLSEAWRREGYTLDVQRGIYVPNPTDTTDKK